jgi:hypothetical protein
MTLCNGALHAPYFFGESPPMIRTLSWLVPVVFCVSVFSFVSSQEGKKYSIKADGSPLPKEISEPIQKLLVETSIQLLDGTGKPVCDVWFRKDLNAQATPEQIKTGVTFREVKQTEILGAIQFHKDWSDYRKQKIKAGVYTMRLAYQPTDGKHTADVSDFQEFVLVIKANADTKPALMEAKALHDRSGDSLDIAHPGVFMLWPNNKPGKEPTFVGQPKNHWVLNSKLNLVVEGKATGASIGIGLTLIGHSPAE